MPRLLLFFVLLLVALAAAPPEVWAQAAGELPCAQDSGDADCPEAARLGAWGLIILGLIFFAVYLVPPRPGPEEGGGYIDKLPVVAALHRRMDKELSGWRRFQWPLMGSFFVALGLAALLGWL